MTSTPSHWQYTRHRREPGHWLARLSGTTLSFSLHAGAALLLATISITILRYGIENHPEPQRFAHYHPAHQPMFFPSDYHLDGAGEDDEDVRSQVGDTGKTWNSTDADPPEFARGYEECVASCHTGATGAFMAIGPDQADAGMFGSRTQQTAQENAKPQPGQKSFERDSTLRLALAWITRQQGADGFWRSSDGHPSMRKTALALTCLVRSGHGGMHRFLDHSEQAAQALESANSAPDALALVAMAHRWEQATLTYKSDDRFPKAVDRLLSAEDPLGGWRIGGQPAEKFDWRLTAWSLHALAGLDPRHPALVETRGRLTSRWNKRLRKSPAEPDERLWHAFLVLMLDPSGQQTWHESVIIDPLPDTRMLSVDPEQLLVHVLIRIQLRPPGWKSWLHRIEHRLDEDVHRHGDLNGSWDPPANGERLEFTLWNALILHEIYEADPPFSPRMMPTTP